MGVIFPLQYNRKFCSCYSHWLVSSATPSAAASSPATSPPTSPAVDALCSWFDVVVVAVVVVVVCCYCYDCGFCRFYQL